MNALDLKRNVERTALRLEKQEFGEMNARKNYKKCRERVRNLMMRAMRMRGGGHMPENQMCVKKNMLCEYGSPSQCCRLS